MPRYFQELRVASRQLRKTPGFTATVVITLAIGIGATTAIFSLIEGILMRPLPFRDPERLVLLGDHIGEGAHTPVTAREIGTYSNLTSAFSSMGGYIATSFELSGGATPEQANAARFTSGVFSTLGVEPIAGRVFTQKKKRTPTCRSQSSAIHSGSRATTLRPMLWEALFVSTAMPTPSSA